MAELCKCCIDSMIWYCIAVMSAIDASMVATRSRNS
eukprot:CAMPEP_0113994498 /NCGR_PEP_ID=MMETSP0328-20130328/10707_1 /TAXON_ID=39455 /ORGANISM="Alexandrium minutum" /LENGTH=35 /assembly_acc=CAM_ASM_000350